MIYLYPTIRTINTAIMPRQVKVKRGAAISSSKSTSTDDNNTHTKQQITNLQNRITSLNKQRIDELQSRKYMSSCPERIYSFGKYEFFEKSKFLVFILCMICSYDMHKQCIAMFVLCICIACIRTHDILNTHSTLLILTSSISILQR